MKKRWVAIAVAVVVVAGVAAWRFGARGDSKPLHFETSKVERGRIVAKVTATGTLSALVTVQVGSQVSGRIQQLMVDFNSPVKKGQVLAKIDAQLFNAAVEQARANSVAAQGGLTKAKAQAAEAERQFQRAKGLAAQQLIAQAELDSAEANAQAARAQVEAAQGTVSQSRASLHQSEVNLAYTTIHSPIDGMVISRNVDVGQTVAASLQAPTLFVIAEDLRKMQVNTNVAEADVGKLQPGMMALFTVDAYPSERFRGTVRQIRNAAQTVQNVVTYDAVIDVGNPEVKLRPGMTANVTFVYAEKDDVIRIPNASLRFRPPPELMGRGRAPGGPRAGRGPPGSGVSVGPSAGNTERDLETPDRKTVWVMKGEQPQAVKVRTGISDGTVTEVLEGEVNEGDALVTDSSGGDKPKQTPGMGGPGGGGMRRLF